MLIETVNSEILLHCHKYSLTFFLILCTSHCKDCVPLAASAEEHLNLAEIVFVIDFSRPGTRCGAFETVYRVLWASMPCPLN